MRATETVSTFAAALDAEDYETARTTLAPECVYHIGGETHHGPDAILALYRRNGEAARRRFDAIEYSSSVEDEGPDAAVVHFTDRVRHGGVEHVYRCHQRIRVNAGGSIVAIRHEELPDERERLLAFELQVGVRRESLRGPLS